MLDFNSYLEEKKKKEVVKINPKKEDLYEKDAKGEDCTGSDHTKSEKKRRKEDVNDGPDVQNEGLTPKDRFNRDAGAIAKKKLRNKEHKKYVNFLDVDESKGYQPEIEHSKLGDAKKAAEKRRKKAADSLPPHLRLDVMRKAFAHTNESRLTGANDMQSKLYAANNKSGKKMTDDEIKQEKGGKEFLDRLKAAKSKMKNEGVADRARKAVDHQRKGTHGDDHELDTEMKKTQKSVDKLNKVGERLRADTAAKKLEKKVKSSKNEEAEVYWSSKALDDLENLQKEAYGGRGSSRKARLSSIHPPTAKAAIKNIPDDESDRGSGNKSKRRIAKMSEAKVDKGRSDYGKASIRNYRRMGPGHDDPGMFDPEGKRGKTIDKRREEHKARRGVKGAKVPAYKRESTSFEEAKKCWKGYEKKGTQKLFGKTYNRCVKKEETTNVEEGAAWTRKAGKNKSGGLNEKGRKSYERENPGSDLKAPSKKVGNPRRASFCARMKGMKAKLTSKKTASDPDSRINKSLRAWNC